MKEGWISDSDYLMLFDEEESAQATEGYGIADYLPGFAVVALIGWDDFLLRDESGVLFRVPTVPLVQEYLEKLEKVPDATRLEPDERYRGEIKWYIQPLIFGGDPSSEKNIFWADLATHQLAVRWWNDLYRDLANKK
jgi:hypothetical protein